MYMPVFALTAFSDALVLFWLFHNAGKGFISDDIQLIAALTAVSVIALVYFVGRSDTRTLIPVIWPAQLLLCAFLSRLSTQAVLARLDRLERFAARLAVWPLCIAVCLFAISVPYTIASNQSSHPIYMHKGPM